ncbi:sporulation protein YpjB [Bacillaceae bacterium]
MRQAFALLFVVLLAAGIVLSALGIAAPKDAADRSRELAAELAAADEAAQKLLQLVRDNQYDGALAQLQRLSEATQRLASRRVVSRAQAVHLQSLLQGAEKNIREHSGERESAEWQALKIHLAFDALTHAHQPLWRSYAQVLHRQLEEAETYLQIKEKRELFELLSVNVQLFETIAPSLSVAYSPETAQRIGRLYRNVFLLVQDHGTDRQEANASLRELQTAICEVAENSLSAQTYAFHTYQSPYSLIAGIAAIVISTLAYVGWRKFRGERKRDLPG